MLGMEELSPIELKRLEEELIATMEILVHSDPSGMYLIQRALARVQHEGIRLEDGQVLH
jgi:hypothetical protein